MAKRKFEAVSRGAVELDLMAEWRGVYTDWSVCRALGVRRRVLVGERAKAGCVRGVDWEIVNGEVGMMGAWCERQGLELGRLEEAGRGGRVSFEVSARVGNVSLVIGKRLLDGALVPVRIGDARVWHLGMVFEAVRGFNGWEVVKDCLAGRGY